MPFHGTPCKAEVRLKPYELYGIREGALDRTRGSETKRHYRCSNQYQGNICAVEAGLTSSTTDHLGNTDEKHKWIGHRSAGIGHRSAGTAAQTPLEKLIQEKSSESPGTHNLGIPPTSSGLFLFTYKIRTAHPWGSSGLRKEKCYPSCSRKALAPDQTTSVSNCGYPALLPKSMLRLRYFTKKIFYLDAASFFLMLISKVSLDLIWTGFSAHPDLQCPLLFPALINLAGLDCRPSNNITSLMLYYKGNQSWHKRCSQASAETKEGQPVPLLPLFLHLSPLSSRSILMAQGFEKLS